MSRPQPSEEATLAPLPAAGIAQRNEAALSFEKTLHRNEPNASSRGRAELSGEELTLAAPHPEAGAAPTRERGVAGPAEDALHLARRALGTAPEDPREQGERYRFDELLGRGGMGEVWRVDDLRLERDVALKRMRKQGASPEELARFLREAQLSGSLEHPNIVPIYDLGVDEEGALFFTMKRLRGRSLAQLLERGELGSLHERLTIFRKVCDAMAFAHAREVIHRDLKPDNVMIGEFGEVMVLDWGLAKRLDEQSTHLPSEPPTPDHAARESALAEPNAEDSALTVAGSLMGTPAFMAPEQALGHLDLVDTRTDVFALGILLYVLLTGERPFRGSVAAVLFQITQAQFDKPSERSEVPRELEAVVLKAMAHAPEQRYATVAELSADIQAYLEGRPLSVVSYSPLQRLQKWAARNRSTVAAATLTGAVGLAALMVGGVMYLRDIDAARARAEQARDEATAARDEATEARDEAMSARDQARRAEREAQVREGEAEAGLALALARGGKFIDAAERLEAARRSFERADASTLVVDLVHAWVDGESPPPLARYTLPKGASVRAISPDGHRLAWSQSERVGIDDWLSGERLLDRELDGLLYKGLGIHGEDFVVLLRSPELGGQQIEARTLLDDVRLSLLPEGDAHRLCQDGEHLLIEATDGSIQRYLLTSGEPAGARFECGTVTSTSADCGRLTCDAERLPTHRTAKRTDVWDALSGRKLHELPAANMKPISADGKLMLLSHEHGGVDLWDLDRGVQLWHDTDEARTGTGFFSRDGRYVYAQTPTKELHTWTREGDWLGARQVQGSLLRPLGEPYMVSADADQVAVWSMGPGAHELMIRELEGFSMEALGHGELINLVAGKPALLVDPLTGATLDELEWTPSSRRTLADLDVQANAVLGGVDGLVTRFELRESSAPRGQIQLELGDANLTALRMLPDGSGALIGDTAGVLQVWDFKRDAIVARHETGQYVWAIDLDAKGERAYVAGRLRDQSPLMVIELASGERVFESPSRIAGYSPTMVQRGDETLYAVGTQHGVVEVWGEQPGREGVRELASLRALEVPIMSLDFSPDGELLVASSYTGELLVWTTQDWRALPALPFVLPGLRVSADGRRLLAWSRNFDLDLSARSEAVRLDFPAQPDENPSQRLQALIASLALQHHWSQANVLIERARIQGEAVDELLAARIAWQLGERERARAALARVDPASVTSLAELAVWRRVLEP